MPRRPGMPQVVKAEVLDPCPLQRALPGRVGHFPPYRLAPIREAIAADACLVALSNTSTASTFKGTPLGVPFLVWLSQAVLRARSTRSHSRPVISRARQPVARAYRTRAARWGAQHAINRSASARVNQRSRSTSPEADESSGWCRSTAIRRAPSATGTQQGQVPIHRRRLVAPLELALDDLPDHVAVDLVEHQSPEVRVQAGGKFAARPRNFEGSASLRDTGQRLLAKIAGA